uniref:Uncharacterized protein n=1 Tax=Acrobeloides nanus TaxID=290746 RepID=A0A914C7W9_9BILA
MSRQNTKRPSLTNQDTVDSSMINLPAPPPIPASLLDSDILENLVSQYRMALMEAIRNHNQENRKLKNVEKSLSTSTSVEDSTEESSTPLVESPKSSISTLAKKIILPTIAKKPSSTQVTIRKVSSKSQQLAPETFTADDRTSYDGSTSSEVFCNINRSKLKPARKNPESNMGNVNELTEKLKTTVDINSDNPPSMMASDVADVVLSEDHLRLMQEIRNPNKKPLNSVGK